MAPYKTRRVAARPTLRRTFHPIGQPMLLAALVGFLACDGTRLGKLRASRAALSTATGTVLSVGFKSGCAVLRDGTASCWGANDTGQLGIARTDTLIHTPTLVSGLRDATAIGTKANFACAVMSTGNVKCWGSNVRGTLGDETQTPHYAPNFVHGPNARQNFAGATALSVGIGHSCVVDAGGGVYCWGMNEFGQLGNGGGGDRLIATPISSPTGVTFVDVAVGSNHSCALTADGKVYCWGLNDHNQLGNDAGTLSPMPIQVSDVSDARAIGAGATHTCVVLGNGTSKCWGSSYGSYGESLPQPDLSNLRAVTGGTHYTCTLDVGGQVNCWGSNVSHQLGTQDAVGWSTTSCPTGDSDPAHCASPPRLMTVSNAVALSAGDTTTCVTTGGGQVQCWGENIAGQVGRGAPRDSNEYFVDSARPYTLDLPGCGVARAP